ncbi:MAG: TIGR02221 family CRISPR-associated protein [Candidatus Heimdallarchaeota archaeon]|nr:TIGR02221 family CRISPR-associated protein [Candidatus Heimdallarchaeota archaeon]
MSKVMLAFLGVTNYKKCNYYFDENIKYEAVRFVQEAIISTICKDWSSADKVIIFLTDKAMRVNWFDNGHSDGKTKKPLEIEGLKTRLEKLDLSVQIKPVKSLPTGKNSDEIWEIFDRIVEVVEEGDEVFFDITHAFRSLPMLALIALNYLRVVKKIEIKGVYYGAFEVILDEFPDKKIYEIPIQDRNAPIFDLMPFIQLFDWTNATDNFIDYGDAQSLKKITSEDITPLLAKSQGKNELVKNIDICSKLLERFTEVIRTSRGYDLIYSDFYDTLKDNISIVGKAFYNPLIPLLDSIKEKIAPFKNEDINNGFLAVQWCIDYNLIQQGITLLQETVITLLIDKYYKKKEYLKDPDIREFISDVIHLEAKSTPRNEWKIKKRFRKDIDGVLKLLDKKIISHFETLRHIRNDINHAGFTETGESPRSPKVLKNKLEEYYQKIKGYFNNTTND